MLVMVYTHQKLMPGIVKWDQSLLRDINISLWFQLAKQEQQQVENSQNELLLKCVLNQVN